MAFATVNKLSCHFPFHPTRSTSACNLFFFQVKCVTLQKISWILILVIFSNFHQIFVVNVN